MALPRYEGGQPSVGQSGAAIAHKARANTIGDFVQGIQGIKSGAIKTVEQASIAQAKVDAEKAFTERGLKAEVNRDMTVYGQQYSNTLENMHRKQVAIDTGKRFDQLYQEHKDNPAAFEEISEAYRNQTMKDMPSHLQAGFTLDFEANKAHYSGIVSKNSIQKIKDQDIALTKEIFTDSSNKATQAMRDHNQALAMHEMTKAIQAVEDSYQNNNMSLGDRDKYIEKIYFDTSKANFKGVNDGYIERNDLTGAQKNIDTFRKTKIEGFDDNQREALADDMQRDLNNEISRQKAEATRREKFDNKRADELIYLYDELEEVEDAELKEALSGNLSPDKKEKLYQAYKDSGAMKVFSSKNIEDQEAEVLKEREKENKSAAGLRLLKRKEKALEKLKKLKSTNPIEYTEKYLGKRLETLDITDDKFLDKALTRTNFIENVEVTAGVKTGLFKPSEIADTKRKIDAMGVEDKLSFLADINMVDEKIANRTYEDLGGGIGFAGYLSLIGNQSATATTLLGSTSKIPLEPKFKAEIAQKLINAFPHKADMYIKGAEDYARGYELENGEKPTIDDVIKNTLGTAVKKNGRSFFLPYGSNETQFDNWLEGIEIEGRPELTDNLRSLKNSIFTGNTQLQQVGNGRYAVISTIDGASFVEMDSTDDTKPLILEFGK